MDSSKKTLLIVLAVVAVLVIAVYGFFQSTYNSLVRLDEGVKASWSQVENQLQRRFDLIPNLVETVKGYAKHEKEVLTEVTNARAKVGQAGSVPDKIAANNELTGALSRLLVVVEKYPDLKANQNFLRLQADLSDIENKLAAARRFFNSAVQEYNAAIQHFPAVLFAGMFGFKERGSFDVGETAREALDAPVQVKF